MNYIDILRSLKVHKLGENIGDEFPPLIAHVFKYLSVYTEPRVLRRLSFSVEDYMMFLTNLGYAIHTKNFTTLDDIMIQFLETYFLLENPYKFHLTFPEESKRKFQDSFEEFRNKSWEEILEPMLSLIEELLKEAEVKGLKLNLS